MDQLITCCGYLLENTLCRRRRRQVKNEDLRPPDRNVRSPLRHHAVATPCCATVPLLPQGNFNVNRPRVFPRPRSDDLPFPFSLSGQIDYWLLVQFKFHKRRRSMDGGRSLMDSGKIGSNFVVVVMDLFTHGQSGW